MRRLAATAALVAIGVCAAAVAALVLTDTRSSYSVAARFDTADGIVAGSQVKIAGAVVGRVNGVRLAPGPHAQIVMAVDRRFAPFHANASCTILPEGIISENYVACDPGSAAAPPLARGSGGVSTVPLSQTTIPLSAQQFLNVFTMPTVDRIRVMLDELGIAVAGRGRDINALLLRSNPALAQARRVLAILDQQRGRLADGITQTNQVLAALATRQQGVRDFVDHVASVSMTSAAHAHALAAQFARFPPLLRALRPGLGALDRAAVAGLPVLQGVQAAGPALTRMTETLPPFLNAAQHSLPGLAAIARVGLPALRDAHPLMLHLRRSAAATVPFAKAMNAFLISSRDSGALEGFLWDLYGQAAWFGPYDSTSHFAGALFEVFPQCFKDPPPTGCNSQYGAPGQGTIPVNDPSCGPTNDAPWAPETNCVGLQAAPPFAGGPQGGSQSVRHRRHPGSGAKQPNSPQGPSGAAPGPPQPPTLPQLPQLPAAPAPMSPGALKGLLSYLIGQ